MSPASRYTQNFKVLQRHDPTITSVFDQFNLVTLYQLQENGEWDNMGYEGPLFFFEREQEPRYGFFVLNRVGIEDYVQHLRAEDNVEPNPKLLFYRSSDPSKPYVVGMWTHQEEGASDSQDRLAKTMLRLQTCLQTGEPYPQEYRIETTMKKSDTPAPSGSNQLDALLAKLVPPTEQSRTSTPAPDTELTGKALLDSMFASAMKQPLSNPTPPPPPPIPSEPPLEEPYAPQPKVLTPGIIESLLGAPSTEPERALSRRSRQGGSDSLPSMTPIPAEPDSTSTPVHNQSTNESPRRERAKARRRTPKMSPARASLVHRHAFLDQASDPPPPLPPLPAQLQRAQTPGSRDLNASHTQTRARALVPYETDSDLWPYPRAPLDDRDRSIDFDAVNSPSGSPAPVNGQINGRGRKGNHHQRNSSSNSNNNNNQSIAPMRKREQYIPHNSPPADPLSDKLRSIDHSLAQSVLNDTYFSMTNGAHAGEEEPSAEKRPCPETRNDFIREILALIHTNKEFVDQLWDDYRSRAS
ncbi:hypothetical protein SISSUDRAFT_1037224 [Sistotremastrum suecicum HHB10207 ss-3]|uniref:PH domain-like protein n=1 Tax=Sistotremastrum suecicum HHB10207 ss-3 TaxID=1314776 RepID=A0A165YF32_9AGAM|nr:hypothetical protein SISSUDRAFT_1037224 [Sistotremastrum suecicum HHB10207 ss-3]